MMDVIFSLLPAIILACYGSVLATWLHLANHPDRHVEIWANRLSWMSLILHFGWMTLLTVFQGQIPFVSVGQLAAFLGLMINGAYIYVQRKSSQGILVVLPVMTVILLVLISMIVGVQPVVVPDVLGNLWMALHITLAMAGVALILGGGVNSAGYLFLHNCIKKRKFGSLFSLMPPLGELNHLRLATLSAGWLLISIAMAAGAVWMIVNPELFKSYLNHLGIALIFWAIISSNLLANRFRWFSYHRLASFSVLLSALILVLILFSIAVTYPGGLG